MPEELLKQSKSFMKEAHAKLLFGNTCTCNALIVRSIPFIFRLGLVECTPSIGDRLFSCC